MYKRYKRDNKGVEVIRGTRVTRGTRRVREVQPGNNKRMMGTSRTSRILGKVVFLVPGYVQWYKWYKKGERSGTRVQEVQEG